MNNPFVPISNSSKYISMRVHGNSVHVEHSIPDIPSKTFSVIAQSSGTLIQTNYASNFEFHFSIPSPLIIEKKSSIVSVIRRLFGGSDDKVEPVFQNSKLRVVRVEIYLDYSREKTSLGTVTAMDGKRKLFSADINTLPLIDVNTDSYKEPPDGTIRFDLNHVVETALGVSLSGRFINVGEMMELKVIAAKAIFTMKV